ncbi:hypothetical protein [Sphingomonas sp. GV3]|uniref:hypothetical protein n=1 Tax=Sphingomonas sp. GV3 TaxID=3040671 RepID=UPI00280B6374|nr:hypothetical protein [Sphingomonas sp. GV3]
MRTTGIDQGLGCLSVFPAAIIGFAGLTDGIGPTGWRGFSELFGWFVACLVAAKLLALLLGRGRQAGNSSFVLGLAGTAVIGVLAYELLTWLGLDAPMPAKIIFTPHFPSKALISLS